MAGYCAVGGVYSDANFRFQAFVATQVRGAWRLAQEVPGTAALNKGGSAIVSSVSCPAAGHCAASGSYTGTAFNDIWAFVVSQR